MSDPHSFFGGEASSIGAVHKLSPTSFAQFVKETLGHPAVLNVSRDQFRKMDPKQRNAAKRVRYVCPATFTKPQRITENAKDIALIALDIDDSAQAAPLVKTPSLIREALDPLAYAAYTTASSTEDKPKLRILVPASHIAVKLYPSAVKKIAALLQLKNITKESLVSVQPMYLPTLFKGDNIVDYHPLISAVTDGETFTVKMIDGADVPTASSTSASNEDAADGLEHLRAVMDDVQPDDVREALKHLDPDCSMADWIVMGCALRHQFADRGFVLWDEWSAKGDKYEGHDATRKRWNHIRPTPRGRAPVTIRTLFMRAEQSGWKGLPDLNEKLYAKAADWIKSTTRTEVDLQKFGLQRIASCGLQSSTSKSLLLSHLKQAFHRVGVKPSVVSMRKELARLERREDSKSSGSKATDEADIPKWARGLTYVQGQNEFYQRTTDNHFSPEVLDRSFGRKLMAPADDGSKPFVLPSDYLLNTIQIPIVSNFLYDPTHPEETFVERDGKRFINTYLPTYPEPDPGRAREAQDVFEGHLRRLISEAEYVRTALDFLAYCVQQPGSKIRWAFLLQGAQGCGKTAIAEMMKAVLGPSNAKVLDASLLFTGYNTWATGSQLVSMEEIRVVGHNRHEVMNRLKPCISNDTVVINGKYKDLTHVPNNTNYIMFTNHHDSLAVTEEDRRYFVVNSALQSKADVLSLGSKYFNRLFGCISGNAGGLRAWLENHTISAVFDPAGHAPQTRYLFDLAGAASTPLTAAIKDALSDEAYPLLKKDLVSTKVLKDVLSGEGLPKFSDQQIAIALRELNYIQVGRPRLRDSERHSLWALRSSGMTEGTALKLARRREVGDHPIL